MTELYTTEFKRAYGAPIGTAKIRQSRQDFFVDEVLGYDLSGEGEHVYLWVEKIGANTGWVAEQFASLLGLRHFDVGYSGMKDRHAVTKQWFSCWLPGKEAPDWQTVDIEGVQILKSIRHHKKLRRGDHHANQFVLCLRDFEHNFPNTVDLNEALNTRLNMIGKDGFPNYFGPQRFGIEGRNLEKAEALFGGQKMARKMRGIYLSAARAYLFNLALSDYVKTGTWMDIEQTWLYGLAPHRDIEVPLLVGDFSHWGQGLQDFGLKAMMRPLRVVPNAFTWEYEDNMLRLEFSLPKGAFATSLLQEFIDFEDLHGERDRAARG